MSKNNFSQNEWEIILPVYVRNLLEILSKENVPLDSIIARHPLLAELGHSATEPATFRAYLNVVTDILQRYDIKALGLKTGQRFEMSDHGLMGYAINCCKNMQDALKISCEYSPLLGEFQSKLVVDDAPLAYFEYSNPISDIPERSHQFLLEEMFAIWFNAGRKWERHHPWFTEVYFESTAPDYADMVADFFCCPVKYQQSHNRFYFSKDYLRLPFTGHQEQLYSLSIAQCAELLKGMPKLSPLAKEIRSMLARCTGQFPNLEEIAARFTVSEATMRRRLAAENTTYRDLLINFRMQLACRYLTETHLPVKTIAYLTGYSDPANFNRAFRSLHTQTPQNYRLNH